MSAPVLAPPPTRSARPVPSVRPARTALAHGSVRTVPELAPTPDVRRPPREPTRPRRDPFVDVARVLGTLGVIGLHWSMVDASVTGSRLHVGNALGSGPGWLLTWLLPLPLLFFAAGAAAEHERRRTSRGSLALTTHRLRRLVRPVALLLGVWALAGAALLALGVPHDVVVPVLRKVPQPLWFLGVYLALAAATPLVARAVARVGRGLPVALAGLAGAALAVDALRLAGGHPATGWANLLIVWLVPFAAGVAYAQGWAPGRGTLVGGLVGGLGAAVALVAVGPYPASLVGMPGQALSNLAPPSAVVAAFSVAQVCGALLARDVLVRVGTAGRGGRVVAWVSARSMTLYLWHLTAAFAVAGVVLLVLHERLPAPWGADWWASRPLWFAAMGLVLAGLVRVAGRAERRRGRVVTARRVGPAAG